MWIWLKKKFIERICFCLLLDIVWTINEIWEINLSLKIASKNWIIFFSLKANKKYTKKKLYDNLFDPTLVNGFKLLELSDSHVNFWKVTQFVAGFIFNLFDIFMCSYYNLNMVLSDRHHQSQEIYRTIVWFQQTLL